ncbi:glycosyltransferase [candidate division KSB1 bacterium]|nr:glycosyltransferase [candidate division KSB1 bacterium]
MIVIMTIFWVSFFAIAYIYAGFNILTALMGWIGNKSVVKQNIFPSVDVIIAAYNEENQIKSRVQNLLNLDYPQEKINIIVASDGSTDATVKVVNSFTQTNIHCLDLPRQGKIFALNRAVKIATSDILVFTDANTTFHPLALQKLVQNFADPSVGGVCGNQDYLQPQQSGNIKTGETIYWSFDKWMKSLQSGTGSIVSADGAIYAIKKSLFPKIKTSAVTDDFAISTAVIAKGYRLVYEPEALAFEPANRQDSADFKRKIRIINRGLASVALRKELLNPFRYGYYAVILFSHKILRRLVPIFLILLFVTNMILMNESWFYTITATGQLAFYAFAFLGFSANRKKIFYIPYYFVLSNTASLIALWRVLSGKRIERWQPFRETES